MGKEKEAETKLIKALRSKAAYAVHMDCTVDGFPDIFMVSNGTVSLIEMKEGNPSRKLRKAFEKTQPVFYLNSKMPRTFVCLFDGAEYYLYYANSVYDAMCASEDADFLDLDFITSGMSSNIAEEICDCSERACGQSDFYN